MAYVPSNSLYSVNFKPPREEKVKNNGLKLPTFFVTLALTLLPALTLLKGALSYNLSAIINHLLNERFDQIYR